MTQKFEPGEKKTYTPNNPLKIGLGLAWRNTIFNFGYGYGIDFLRNNDYKKTKAFDFQIHAYCRRFVIDLLIQQYKGFYTEDKRSDSNQLCPDLKMNKYAICAQYIFNYKKYSQKAAFYQNEKQLKSAGSPLAGISIYHSKIDSDSSFVYDDKHSLHNFQFGVNGGYAYVWIVKRNWSFNISATAGINFGNEKISSIGKEKIEVYPTFLHRFSIGYNQEKWSVGISFVGDVIFPAFSEKSKIYLFSGNAQIGFVRRFDIHKKNKN